MAQQPLPTVLVAPKRGGWLAIRGFLLTFLVGIPLSFALRAASVSTAVVPLIAFAIGATYIVATLLRWKRQKHFVKGSAWAWSVALFLLFTLVVGAIAEAPAPTAPRPAGAEQGTALSEDPKRILLRDVELLFNWRKGAFGTVMEADFTVRNPTDFQFKDFTIKCTHSAPSGTAIDSNTETIYEVVEPHSKRSIKNVNMGFIHTQAARSVCVITNLTVIGRPAKR
jgi:hypothetical protein